MFKSKTLLMGALAAAGLCQSAFALNQTDVDAIVGTANELFISGATASDPAIKTFVQNDLCASGYDIYQDAASTGSNWYAMTCTLKAVAPVPASLQGQNVIIHKRSKIGSIYGVYPIALGSYVEFLNIKSNRGSASCNPANTTGAGPYNCVIGALALRDTPRHAGNADECDYQTAAPSNPVAPAAGVDTICRRSSLGTADVESEMFTGVNLTNFAGDNFTTLTGAQIGNTTRSRAFGQLFGVAVSNGLWTALQSAQGLAAGAPLADFSNVPNLSKDQVRAVLLGASTTWAATAGSLNSVAGFAASTTNNVNICRREQGSGSQASSNQFFLNYPCDTTFAPKQDNTATWISGVWVKENTSSGAAKKCLSDSETAAANANTSRAAGAIAVLSYNGDPGASDLWKWVKVDGVMPTFQNSILGLSDFWYETQLSYNNTPAGVMTTQETDLATTLASELSKATRITTAGAKGIGGLALTTNGNGTWDSATNNTAITTYTATNPVFGGHHGLPNSGYPTSGTPLSCRPILNYVDATTGPNR
ncbi:MAG: hypothetical protein RL684_1677 [Pseudomonadota bacterium]